MNHKKENYCNNFINQIHLNNQDHRNLLIKTFMVNESID
jgi:hypothetical protein